MRCILTVLLVSLAGQFSVQGVDLSTVPGAVIDYQPLDYSEDTIYWYGIPVGQTSHSVPRAYISDPEILVLSSNTYLATHALGGWDCDADSSGRTSVSLTTDGGETWSRLSDQNGLLRGSLVNYQGWIYLMGAHHEGGIARVFKSNDNGSSWQSMDLNSNGFATPNNPVAFNGYMWSANGSGNISASLSDLWTASAWRFKSGVSSQSDWPSEGAFIGEGQLVAASGKGIFVLPKVRDHALTAVERVDLNTGIIAFDPDHDFVELPGGEKKFGAVYDSVSGKFYILSNPVLPEDEGWLSSIDPNMIRNTAALMSSEDLYNWDVERILLYSQHVETEGFGYLNADIDGDDLVFVARTAWRIPGETYPDRGHDSNCFTFHRLQDFRNTYPRHFLQISGNQVLRYERTPMIRDWVAPLGNFALGTSFTDPDQVGQDLSTGYVYIHETGGTVYCFDAVGNFLYTTNTAPVVLTTNDLTIIPPPDGSTAWIASGSADWYDMSNWHYFDRADNPGDIAVFGSAVSSETVVNLEAPYSREWNFDTNGNQEGWVAQNMTNISVWGGTFRAASSSTDPYMYRTGQSFYGDDVPTVTVRMKASRNSTVCLFWGTAVSSSIGDVNRRVVASYTGNGDFQDVVFSPAGNDQWDGQLISKIRMDPLDEPNVPFEIDSITVQRLPTVVKGLRFQNSHAYTVSGTGSLQVRADSGNGILDVELGEHRLQVPVELGGDTDFNAVGNASLALTEDVALNGNTLTVGGGGTLAFDRNSFSMGGGRLVIPLESGATVLFTNVWSDFDGEIAFTADEGFDPEVNDTFHIIDGDIDAGTFRQLTLPELGNGLGWDTSGLYSNGNITVVLQVPDSFAIQNNLPTDGSADFIDTDGDGMDNYSEWKAGTDPGDAQSFFKLSQDQSNVVRGSVRFQWSSMTGRTYWIECGTNLLDNPAFHKVGGGIAGDGGTMEFIDTNRVNSPASFYRVTIE